MFICKSVKPLINEFLLLIIGGIGIAVMDGDIALGSESGFLLLLCHIIFTIVVLAVVLVKKIDILRKTLFLIVQEAREGFFDSNILMRFHLECKKVTS